MARKGRRTAGKQINASGLTIPQWGIIEPDMKTVRSGGMNKGYERLLWEACSYVHTEVDEKKVAAEFIKYCAKEFDKKDAELLKRLKDLEFSSIGKFTYILSRGGKLDKDRIETIKTYYGKLLEKAKQSAEVTVKKEQKPKAPVVSIQQRMRDQVADMLGEWEGILDDWHAGEYDLKKFDPYKHMLAHQPAIKPAHAKIIQDSFAPMLEEAKLVVEFKDEDIKEAYVHFTARAKERKQFLSFFENIFTACETIINTGKATRKTRTKKAPSKDKLISKLKFKESEPALGLASINPVSIIDAGVLWVYNTKNRKLGVYVADSLKGSLSVKGTTITDFDAAKSVQKTIRKPEELLKGADKLARTKIQKLFEEVRATETKLNGRVNEHCILIKAF